jgi:U2 small nuclear ribonucleoprotein B''
MASSSGPLPPNTTLYVKNIPNKIKKVEIKRQLYCLFITYGKILDIVATKIGSMKGQAFIVFTDLASSTAALRAMDGFIFYDKPLVSCSLCILTASPWLILAAF